jgi:hypothetical protein
MSGKHNEGEIRELYDRLIHKINIEDNLLSWWEAINSPFIQIKFRQGDSELSAEKLGMIEERRHGRKTE